MIGSASRRPRGERAHRGRRPGLIVGAVAVLALTGCGLNSDPLATGGGASTPDGSARDRPRDRDADREGFGSLSPRGDRGAPGVERQARYPLRSSTSAPAAAMGRITA